MSLDGNYLSYIISTSLQCENIKHNKQHLYWIVCPTITHGEWRDIVGILVIIFENVTQH